MVVLNPKRGLASSMCLSEGLYQSLDGLIGPMLVALISLQTGTSDGIQLGKLCHGGDAIGLFIPSSPELSVQTCLSPCLVAL